MLLLGIAVKPQQCSCAAPLHLYIDQAQLQGVGTLGMLYFLSIIYVILYHINFTYKDGCAEEAIADWSKHGLCRQGT